MRPSVRLSHFLILFHSLDGCMCESPLQTHSIVGSTSTVGYTRHQMLSAGGISLRHAYLVKSTYSKTRQLISVPSFAQYAPVCLCFYGHGNCLGWGRCKKRTAVKDREKAKNGGITYITLNVETANGHVAATHPSLQLFGLRPSLHVLSLLVVANALVCRRRWAGEQYAMQSSGGTLQRAGRYPTKKCPFLRGKSRHHLI